MTKITGRAKIGGEGVGGVEEMETKHSKRITLLFLGLYVCLFLPVSKFYFGWTNTRLPEKVRRPGNAPLVLY